MSIFIDKNKNWNIFGSIADKHGKFYSAFYHTV